MLLSVRVHDCVPFAWHRSGLSVFDCVRWNYFVHAGWDVLSSVLHAPFISSHLRCLLWHAVFSVWANSVNVP